jgi:hypothetical protein
VDSEQMPMTQSLNNDTSNISNPDDENLATISAVDNPVELQETAELNPVSPSPQSSELGAVLVIRDGEIAGQSFVLDRPVISIGRGSECEIVINDASISRNHAQILRQANGHYVQDLASRNGSKVNNEPLLTPRLLQPGDIVCFGSIQLEYFPSLQDASALPTSKPVTQLETARPINSGPVPLRLPSRPKNA